MNKHIVIIMVTVLIGFATSETIAMTAQNNSTSSERRNITLTWLETDKTTSNSTPVISISSEDFWKNFKPLLEQLNRLD